MNSQIQSESDLPSDIKSRVSSTFSYNNIKQLLANTHYRGPLPEGKGGSGGSGLRKRGHVLMGMPGTNRVSVLRKATETNLIVETSSGYATTDRGADLLERLMICDECGSQEIPGLIPVGRSSHYTRHSTACPSCNDFQYPDKDGGLKLGEWHHFERDSSSLKSAVDAVESNSNVDLWLNGMSLSAAKNQI
ncbi:hypothetical protein [Halorubrum sp. Boch-26]|uniref:hypothetical protein n=1 Tax=Halorubrum sp. Boch-26 TaxID=2994426 RepID=UPI00246958FD|nr:hypothetical protein [Halorubrum sp. Boch-26]